MKAIAAVSLLTLLASAAASRALEPPKQAPLTRYAQLWTQSPFTTPAPPPPAAEEPNPFEGMVLRGIIPLDNGGYIITIFDKKDPTKLTRIDTERKDAEYIVDKVEREQGNRMGTLVHLTKGSMSGSVGYDETLSVVKAPAPQPAQPQQQQQTQAAGQPGAPQMPQVAGQPAGRQPRQRVIQPAAQGGGQQGFQNQQGQQANQAARGGRGGERGGERGGFDRGGGGDRRGFDRGGGQNNSGRGGGRR